jgi:hypothetical protein
MKDARAITPSREFIDCLGTSGHAGPLRADRVPGTGKLWIASLALAATSVGGRVAAQSVEPEPSILALKRLSVEELLKTEVTSVSKEPEKLLDAPSSIVVISNDDIQRSGASDIPEALRLADNLEVAQQNSHDWAISARGFDANLADKLLVLVDGRAVYSPLYGGVLWNVPDTRKLELSVVGGNVLHDRHPEFGYPGAAREEISRSIFGKAVWQF